MPETYALIGHPLRFSLSPAIHRAAFRALGLDADYVLLPTTAGELPGRLDALRAGRIAGANVTVPHKRAVVDLVEEASDLATGLGAANTVRRVADGGLRAENTDVAGFAEQLVGLGLGAGTGRRALVLGAGGAARAVVHALLGAGYAVSVAARSSAQSAVLAAGLNRLHGGADLSTVLLRPDRLGEALAAADLLVNATPLGAADDDGALPARLDLGDRLAAVIDLVAWPLETALVRRARAEGRLAAGGLDMLLGQATASFQGWTGHAAPRAVMRQAALEAAARRSAAESAGGLATGS
jgi:shikimate dehydrogenase